MIWRWGGESQLLRQNLITSGAQELLQGMITSRSHYIKLLFLTNQRKQAHRAGWYPRVMEHTLLWDNIYRCCPNWSICLCHRCSVLLEGMTRLPWTDVRSAAPQPPVRRAGSCLGQADAPWEVPCLSQNFPAVILTRPFPLEYSQPVSPFLLKQ